MKVLAASNKYQGKLKRNAVKEEKNKFWGVMRGKKLRNNIQGTHTRKVKKNTVCIS